LWLLPLAVKVAVGVVVVLSFALVLKGVVEVPLLSVLLFGVLRILVLNAESVGRSLLAGLIGLCWLC
jgi:hypothetical protein